MTTGMEHAKILLKGVDSWNNWRKDRPGVIPDLRGADLRGANLAQANLVEANLEWASFQGAELEGANMKRAKLRGANGNGANLRWADLMRADMEEAKLDEANLVGANLVGARLVRAFLLHVKAEGANLVGADLTDADLEGAYLMGADLMRACLEGARLPEANLMGAKLEGVSLVGANLARANLELVDLTGGNLTDADLKETDFKDARLEGADFSQALNLDEARSLVITGDAGGASPGSAGDAKRKPRVSHIRVSLLERDRFDLTLWVAFLYDLLTLHDRLLLLQSDKYEYVRDISFFHYRQKGSAVRLPDRLQIETGIASQPTDLDLTVKAVAATPTVGSSLLELLERCLSIGQAVARENESKAEAGKAVSAREAARNNRHAFLKRLNRERVVEQVLGPVLSANYPEEKNEILDHIKRDVVRLGTNRHVRMTAVAGHSSETGTR